MKKHPRNEVANRIPYNEKADSSTWTTIVKTKRGMNIQNPRKNRSQNLAFLFTTFPSNCYLNQLLHLVLFKMHAFVV